MISVVICTHNPRADYFGRTLAALRAQTLDAREWELLVVDNASATPVSTDAITAAHPRGRLVREPRVGLTVARGRGIAESTGELLVFVDDDNLLAPDFLATAATLAAARPQLGAFGGTIRGEFEVEPTPWFAARVDRLAIRDYAEARISREPLTTAAPCGAGLCVRRTVAERWRAQTAANAERLKLGRTGNALLAGEDLDLAFTACDLGLEIGCFPELRLTHLIPARRLTFAYFAQVTRNHARAYLILKRLRPEMDGPRAKVAHARFAYWKWTILSGLAALWPRRTRP